MLSLEIYLLCPFLSSDRVPQLQQYARTASYNVDVPSVSHPPGDPPCPPPRHLPSPVVHTPGQHRQEQRRHQHKPRALSRASSKARVSTMMLLPQVRSLRRCRPPSFSRCTSRRCQLHWGVRIRPHAPPSAGQSSRYMYSAPADGKVLHRSRTASSRVGRPYRRTRTLSLGCCCNWCCSLLIHQSPPCLPADCCCPRPTVAAAVAVAVPLYFSFPTGQRRRWPER